MRKPILDNDPRAYDFTLPDGTTERALRGVMIVKDDGRAPSDDVDEVEFAMSDGSVDAVGDIVEPDGWVLSNFKRNPIALFGHNAWEPPIGQWRNVRVDSGVLKGVLKFAKRGTSAFIDTLRSLVAQKILRAVSVGFKPLRWEPIPNSERGGIRFISQELLECSLVNVPANRNAIAMRGLPAPMITRLFAKPGEPVAAARAVSGASPPYAQKGNAPMRISERITAAKAEYGALQDAIAPLYAKLQAEDESDTLLDDHETDEFDRLKIDIVAKKAEIERLEFAEMQMGSVAASRSVVQVRHTHTASPPVPMPPRGGQIGAPTIIESGVLSRSQRRPMDLLVRMAVCNLQAHVERKSPLAIVAQRYQGDDMLDAVIKTVTNPATTTTVGWAAELVQTSIDDFMTNLMPISVFAQMRARGMRFTFGRNGSISVPRRNRGATTTGAAGDLRGAFIGENEAIPVRRGSFGALTFRPFKMGVISTFSREIAMQSTPNIEGLIREGIVEDTADAIDIALLDAVAADTKRPAGLMNGVTPTTGATVTSGDVVTAIRTDLQALLGHFTALNAATGLLILLNPEQHLALQWASTSIGSFPFRDEVNGGTLGGYPYVVSSWVPANTMIAVRVTDFSSATGDTPTFDVSDVATIHEDDGSYKVDQETTGTVLPIATGTAGAGAITAAPVRSLWQTASIGIRMILDMCWGMRRASMVHAIDTIQW